MAASCREEEVRALAQALGRHYGHVAPAEGDGWPTALCVLDAALTVSLDVDRSWLPAQVYEVQVARPIRAFRAAHPEADSLGDLRAAIAAAPSPAQFARALGADPARGALAHAIVDSLRADLDRDDAGYSADEATALHQWADWQMGDEYDLPVAADGSVRHNGWDYLRMRLGAPVVPYDVPMFATIHEVLGRDLSHEPSRFGEAIREAGLAPLGTLRAIEIDLVAGRSVRDAPDADPGSWTVWFETLANVLREPFPPVDGVAHLHATAPHRPPGAEEAARGDAPGALTMLPTIGPEGCTPAALATWWLVLLHQDLAGRAFDVEVSGPIAQKGTAALAARLRAHGAADARYLHALDAAAGVRHPRLGLRGA